MLVAVAGGRLQGIEASYLAHKGGWEVRLLDRESTPPALGMCDEFFQTDVTEMESFREAIRGVDCIIPALENTEVLETMTREAMRVGVPVAIDLDAYRISSSKVRSNRLFSQIGVPQPTAWPRCGFPVVAKPDDGSGSRGVRVFGSAKEMEEAEKPDLSDGSWVLQEFVEGRTFSLEVLGFREKYFPLQITDLFMDGGYDCKRVTAPTILSPELCSDFERISVDIAQALELKGIMDVEVVLKGHALKVLEIDARLPSQTPTAAFWSTGLNMVEMLGNIFVSQDFELPKVGKASGVVYEHIVISPGVLEIAGEHIMTGYGPLRVVPEFFGADEAITSYGNDRDHWVASLVCAESELSAAQKKMEGVIGEIRRRFRIERMLDSSPARVVSAIEGSL